jgi:hypothetical protein
VGAHGRKPGPLRLCLREACIGSPRDAKVRAALATCATHRAPPRYQPLDEQRRPILES